MTDELQALINGYYSASIDHYRLFGGKGSTEALEEAERGLEAFCEPPNSQKVWLLMGSDGEPITFYTEFPSGSEFKSSMVLKEYLLVPR